MTTERPYGMPRTEKFDRCWGRLIQDGDRECEQCRWKDSCRSRFLEVAAATPSRPQPQSLPMYNDSRPPVPAPTPTPSGMVPMPPPRPASPPTPPTYAAPPPVAHVRYPTTPSAPPAQAPAPAQPYQYQQPQSYQQPQGYSIPDPNRPNPMNPMFRPGAQGPAYYFNQYPGESTGTRLTKNMFLRAMEALFTELSSFFRHWTMPPKQ